MLGILKFFAPHLFDLDEDHLPEGLKELIDKGFEVLLKEIIIDYYKLISKDRVLSIDQEPGSLTLLLEPGVMPPQPPSPITEEQAIKKTKEAVITISNLLPYLPDVVGSDPEEMVVALEEQRVFLLTVAKDSYPYFHPAAVLTGIGLRIQKIILGVTENFPKQKPRAVNIASDIKVFVEGADLTIAADSIEDYHNATFPIKFDFDESAINRLNGLGILKSADGPTRKDKT